MSVFAHPGMFLVILIVFGGIGFLIYRWSQSGFLNERVLKVMFGFALVFLMATLIYIIAVEKVEEASSYGLLPIITILAGLAGAYANWAFGGKDKE